MIHLVGDILSRIVDIFYKIYKSWGFRKEIRTFVSPCGMKFADDAMVTDLERRLSERGIKFHTNYTFHFDDPLRVYSGVTLMKKGCSYLKPGGILEWNVYDFEPSDFVPFVSPDNFGGTNIIGLHWTNLLRYNPKRNMERLSEWIAYFKREGETFGTMISKDIGFSANQQFYNLFAKLRMGEGKCRVDLSEVKKKKPCHLPDEFYISLSNGITPKSCINGKISLYEEHSGFKTYKVEHTKDLVDIAIS